jgi:hypothetical protein
MSTVTPSAADSLGPMARARMSVLHQHRAHHRRAVRLQVDTRCVQAGVAERALERAARRRAWQRADPGPAQQILQRAATSAAAGRCQRMACAHHRHQPVDEQLVLDDVGRRIHAPQRADHEIQVAMAQLQQQRLVGAVGHCHHHAGLRGEEPRQRLRYQHVGGHRQRTQRHAAARCAAEGGQFVMARAQLGQRQPHGMQHALARFGQPRAAA